MQGFLVWDAHNPMDRAAWIELWQRWHGREVFAHPRYAELFAAEDHHVMAAAFIGEQAAVLFPFILRPLAQAPWGQQDWWDATTPYGFGGPFAWGEQPNALAEGFWEALDAWMRSRQVVSLFARLSVFPAQRLPWPEGMVYQCDNVVRSLSGGHEAIWADYRHKVRKNVQKARRQGLEVLVDPHGTYLEDFMGIYHATMERNHAGSQYFFARPFFEALLREIPGGAVLFHVLDGEKMVSSEMVLTSAAHMYSFLGGTLAESFEHRPNDLLKHAAMQWGHEQGLETFVLGGGYEPGDGIFRYKESFAPEGIVPFYVGQRVWSPLAYTRLVEQRRSFERDRHGQWNPRPRFFPEYRA